MEIEVIGNMESYLRGCYEKAIQDKEKELKSSNIFKSIQGDYFISMLIGVAVTVFMVLYFLGEGG